jgi:hypothetical protein
MLCVLRNQSQLRGSPAICVQVEYKKAGSKGLKMDLSNAESTTYRGGFSPRSVKMYLLSEEVQCFRVDPINKQNRNAGRSKINS